MKMPRQLSQRTNRSADFNAWQAPLGSSYLNGLAGLTTRCAKQSQIRAPRMAAGLMALSLALLGGCAVGPNYERPTVNSPAEYRFAAAPATTNSFGDLPWWEVFQDPKLQDLIRVAVSNNYDLKQAVARVEQARQQSVAARGQMLPQVGYGGDIGRGRNALYNSPAERNGATDSSAQLNVSAAWEVDFWGRLRRQSEAARAQYLATDEARRSIQMTLVSDVATAYFQLLDLDAEMEIQRQATNAYATSYRLFNDRLLNGVASKLETDRAAAAFANAAAALPDLELQIAATENQLCVLLGRNPGPIDRGPLGDSSQPGSEIPTGLPSELLRRRPDVLASEQLLVAANANIGVSIGNFFPQIGLTTFFGRQSSELSEFTAGAGNFWNAGGTLTGPIFQGGALRAQYKAAKAKFEEARAAYQQSVLVAFQDVSNALVARQKYAERAGYDVQAVAALTSSVQLATDRYLNGKSSYFEVLQAQQELYPTQRAAVQTQVGERIALVQLYKALGGGWQLPAGGKP